MIRLWRWWRKRQEAKLPPRWYLGDLPPETEQQRRWRRWLDRFGEQA